MANPFYVQPVDLGQATSGVGQAAGLAQMIRQKRQQGELDSARKQAVDILKTGDQNALQQFLAGSPYGSTIAQDFSRLGVFGQQTKPTANIQDYEYYRRLSTQDPLKAEQFARQIGITEDIKEAKPTVAQQNWSRYDEMPEGPRKEKFGRLIGIKPGISPSTMIKEEAAKKEISNEIDTAQTTLDLVDNFLGHEGYIDALTGLTAPVPSLPGSTKFDAVTLFDQIKNSLTLENTKKMSGVLSESDIKLLASAAGGLQRGMSREAMVNRFNKIRGKLSSGISKNQGKLNKDIPVLKEGDTTSYDSLPSGAIYIYNGIQYRKN